jgi:DNA-directed RNA polymerase specialized sigma24 family protein
MARKAKARVRAVTGAAGLAQVVPARAMPAIGRVARLATEVDRLRPASIDDARREAIHLLHAGGFTRPIIVELLGVSPGVIQREIGAWPAERETEMRAMVVEGKGAAEIAKALGVRYQAVVGKLRYARAAMTEGATKRDCLSCGQPFLSEWIGQRMCRRCRGLYG